MLQLVNCVFIISIVESLLNKFDIVELVVLIRSTVAISKFAFIVDTFGHDI